MPVTGVILMRGPARSMTSGATSRSTSWRSSCQATCWRVASSKRGVPTTATESTDRRWAASTSCDGLPRIGYTQCEVRRAFPTLYEPPGRHTPTT